MDVYDSDERFANQRKLFAGAFPGLVLAFFRVGTASEIGAARLFGVSALWILGGIALYGLADTFVSWRRNALPPLFGAVGFVIFYWYSVPRMAAAAHDLVGGDWTIIEWPGRALAAVVAGGFILRAHQSESKYLGDVAVSLVAKADIPAEALRSGHGSPAVKFIEDQSVQAAPGNPSVLEVIEEAGKTIEAGCRMGVCGADPIAVVAGSAALTDPLPSELTTLARLGLGPPNRMACVARVAGECTISLVPDTTSVPLPEAPSFEPDSSVHNVVVIGNGIAGVTAADYVRRSHPDCKVDVIGREAFHLYNRMGISKLIYSPRGVASLNLLDQQWFDRNKIDPWLNTSVRWVDTEGREVHLGTGERLPYDRLILAMGSTANVPEIDGFGLPGCFVVRSAHHAVDIRRFAQRHNAARAVVAGGGLLGLEAAFSLHRLGLSVTVAERSPRLLRRQIDLRGSEVLREFFASIGIVVLPETEIRAVRGARRVSSLVTKRDEDIDTDLFLVAAGITPNKALAANAGLAVGRGVTVNDRMQTSDPHVYAVGDVAEHRDRIWGLWAVAVEQAEVAGKNAVGGKESYLAAIPTTILKGAGIDLTSFGIVEPGAGDHVSIDIDTSDPWAYAKTVYRGSHVIGGVYINRVEQAVDAQAAYFSFHHRQTLRILDG